MQLEVHSKFQNHRTKNGRLRRAQNLPVTKNVLIYYISKTKQSVFFPKQCRAGSPQKGTIKYYGKGSDIGSYKDDSGWPMVEDFFNFWFFFFFTFYSFPLNRYHHENIVSPRQFYDKIKPNEVNQSCLLIKRRSSQILLCAKKG